MTQVISKLISNYNAAEYVSDVAGETANTYIIYSKVDPWANNNVILGSQSHSDLHTASVWGSITQSCGLP